MSTEETNGFSAPNEDANVAGADSFESAPAGQAAENNETAPGADDAAQASSEGSTDDMSAFEEQIENSDLAKALERIAEGDDFDPALHDALMATTSPDVDHPVIGQVLTSGYRRGERIVRAAKVLVNNPE